MTILIHSSVSLLRQDAAESDLTTSPTAIWALKMSSEAAVASAAPNASCSRASMPLRLGLKAIISHLFLRRLVIELTSNITGAVSAPNWRCIQPHAQPLATAASNSGPRLPAPSTLIDANDSFEFSISAAASI
ncbi:hypothetical protein E4U59_004791 [Claviceps monticola]|nr:hypothetical protein E4U59_004791 [Claviceps monticola]